VTALITSLLLLAAIGPVEPPAEQETYLERLEYDPAGEGWKEIAPPIPGTEEGDLALARSLLARQDFAKARKEFAQWLKLYPQSPRRGEALFYAAETEILAVDEKPRGGDLIQAHEWLSEVIDAWHGTELADRAIRKEIILAEMMLFKNRTQKVWRGMMWLPAKEEALQILDRVIDDWARDTPVAEHALRLKADYHYLTGEFEEAELAYSRLTREFPRGRYYKVALLRSGESAYARFPGVEFDVADLLEAEVYLNDFQQRFPEDAAEHRVPQLLSRISESRAQKDYTVAQYYERTDHLEAATHYYRFVVNTYPATTWAALARNRLIDIGAEPPPAEFVPDDAATNQPDAAAIATDEE
jgi:outer membrane protein assembly factor BamD (BamD/ComL family)